jgi:hypothetical protein
MEIYQEYTRLAFTIVRPRPPARAFRAPRR